MTDEERTRDAWQRRWDEGATGWHMDEVHPKLQAEHGQWDRVLVPLCGATRDLAWLAERSMDVVGVELVEAACRRVFAEWGRTPDVDEVGTGDARFVRYQADGLTVLQGDMLALGPAHAPRFDGVWDRAALVALEPAQRLPYVETLSRVAGGGEILLATFLREDDGGPPYSIPDAFVRDHLDEVELVDEDDVSELIGHSTTMLRRLYRARIR